MVSAELGNAPRLTDWTDLTDSTDKTRKKRHVVKKRKARFQVPAILGFSRHDMVFRDIVRLVRPVRCVRQSRKAVIPCFRHSHFAF